MAVNVLRTALDRAVAQASSRHFVIAFSGGLDSTVLLHALATDTRCRPRGLRAVHVHHGWSPLADDWVLHCQGVADALAVPLTVLRVKMDRGDGSGPEAQARKARYQALAAELSNDELLLTAQHADDQAETVLLKLLRGAGLDGLAGMRERARVFGVRVWRPLLTVPRAELQAYARQNDLRWLEDPSNGDPRLARGWLRTAVLPLLQHRFPSLNQTLGNTARHLRADSELLSSQTHTALARCRLLDPQALSVDELVAQPKPLQLRILRSWLHGLGLAAAPVRLLQQLLDDLSMLAPDREPVWQHENVRLQRYRGVLYAVTRPAIPADWAMDWDGRPAQLPFGLGRLQWIVPDHAGAHAVHLPAHGLTGRWRLRARHGGERIRVRGVNRSLKKLLQELGVPPWQRARLVLLEERAADSGAEVTRAVLGVVLDDHLHGVLQAGTRLQWDGA